MVLDIDQNFFDNWIQAIIINQEFIKLSKYLNSINKGSNDEVNISEDISLNGYHVSGYLKLEFDKDIVLEKKITINTDLEIIVSKNFSVNTYGGG